MSELYCVYKKDKYLAEVSNSIVEITSNHHADGFEKYADVIGQIHDDIYIKRLSIDDIDLLYMEDMYIEYRKNFFQLFAGKILKNDVLNNSYMIWTDSEQLAKEYTFEKKEQFVFTKNITRDEIEAVKIVRTPVLIFKDSEKSEILLQGNDLVHYLQEMI